MKKHILSILVSLIVGIYVGVGGTWFWYTVRGPLHSDTDFVKACGELNGKAFTFENIQRLGGSCYLSSPNEVHLEQCEEKHVRRYFELLSEKKAGHGTNLRTGAEQDGRFEISNADLDDTWRCSLEYVEENQTIRAVPYFAYD